jgi:hypothetical protein
MMILGFNFIFPFIWRDIKVLLDDMNQSRTVYRSTTGVAPNYGIAPYGNALNTGELGYIGSLDLPVSQKNRTQFNLHSYLCIVICWCPEFKSEPIGSLGLFLSCGKWLWIFKYLTPVHFSYIMGYTNEDDSIDGLILRIIF